MGGQRSGRGAASGRAISERAMQREGNAVDIADIVERSSDIVVLLIRCSSEVA